MALEEHLCPLMALVVKCREIWVVASEADNWRVFMDRGARDSMEYIVVLGVEFMFLLKSCFNVFWKMKTNHYGDKKVVGYKDFGLC